MKTINLLSIIAIIFFACLFVRPSFAGPTVEWSRQIGTNTSSPAIVDLDDNGELEIVLGLGYGLGALKNDGTLLWYCPLAGGVYSSPTIVDINGDGKPEAVVGTYDNGMVCAVSSDGTLLWSCQPGDPGAIVVSSPTIADINGDGELEIVVTPSDGKVCALKNDGTILWRYQPGGGVLYFMSPSVADLNGDGKLESVIESSDGKVYAINCDGTLLWSYQTGGYYSSNSSPAIADLNGDGELEIIVGSNDGYIYALNSHGVMLWRYQTGVVVHSSPSIVGPDSGGTFGPVAGAMVQSPPSIADINGDGKLEVVVGSDDTFLYVLSDTGTLLWRYQTEGQIQSSPSIVDLDGDGKLEIVVGSYDGKVYALTNDGKLLWAYQTEGPIDFFTPAIVDIDGDGQTEVIVGGRGGVLSALGMPSPEPDYSDIVLLSDNFNSESGNAYCLNYSGFINWDVAYGNVDLIGHDSPFDFYPGNGLYVDLDGTGAAAGKIVTKTVFDLSPAIYQLQFDLGGSQRPDGYNTVTVSLGDVYTESFTLYQTDPLRTITRDIAVETSTSGQLVFDESGNSVDWMGLILDNVKLTRLANFSGDDYYESMRRKYIISSEPDSNGNVYRHFLDEDWNNENRGRVDKEVKEVADSDGSIACEYFYYDNSNVVRMKYCYETADYNKDPSNVSLSDLVATYEYDTNGNLTTKTVYDNIAAPETYTKYLDVTAFIDGVDTFEMTGDQWRWIHSNWYLPEAFPYNGGPLPTTVNGQSAYSTWDVTPSWYYQTIYSHYNTVTGLTPLEVMYGSDVKLYVEQLDGRGSITLTQLPTAENNYTFDVLLDDGAPSGADTYRFEVWAYGSNLSSTVTTVRNITHYYSSGRKESELRSKEDENGFNYYEYLDEDYNGNGFGRISKKQKSDGSYELIEYWDNTENIKTDKKYDKDGKVIEYKKYEYDDKGNLIAWSNEQGPGLYIRVQNTGQAAITAVCLSFDRMPYNESSSYYDFQLKSPRTGVDYTNIYFPILFDDNHPLNPGQYFDTFIIPELTGIDFRMSNMSIGGYGQGMSGSGRLTGTIVPGVTIVDFYMEEPGKGMTARFSFLYGDIDKWYYLSGRLKSEELLDGTEYEYDDTDLDDNGTPNDPSDDHGRLIMEKRPDGSRKEYSDFDDTNKPGCVKEYDIAGNLIKKTVYEKVKTGWVAAPTYIANNLVAPGTIVDFYDGKMVFFNYSTNTQYIYTVDTGTMVSHIIPIQEPYPYIQFDRDQIVWGYGPNAASQDTAEIYFWNGVQRIRITNNNLSDEQPHISNGKITWYNTRSGGDVFLYDGTQTRDLTPDSLLQGHSDILNNYITWAQFDGWPAPGDIFLYDGVNTTRLTNDNVWDDYPYLIGNGRVIWMREDGNWYDLYTYNGSSIVDLCNNFYPMYTYHTKYGDGWVVWQASDGNDNELYLYDGAKTVQLTNNNYDDNCSNVSVGGGYVVWSEFDGHHYQLFLYDGKEKTRLTNDDYDNLYPWINGNRIGWTSGGKLKFGEFGIGGITETIYEYNSYGDLIKETLADGTIIRYDPEKTDTSSLMGAIDLDGNGFKDLIFDFGSAGVWSFQNDSTWKQISTAMDQALLAAADLDGNGMKDLLFNFGTDAGKGFWAYENNSTWKKIDYTDITGVTFKGATDLDGNGSQDLLFNFGTSAGHGYWAYENNSTWKKIDYTDTTGITFQASTDLDGNGSKDLIFDFGTAAGHGYWAYENNSTWKKIDYTDTTGVTLITSTDLDGDGSKDLLFNFGTNAGQGYWAYENNSTWKKIDYTDTTGVTLMAATDLDGNGKKDLVFDFGATAGYWAYENNSTWLKIPYTNAAGLTLQAVTDVDGNGKEDLVFNFGTNLGQGYWIFANNSTWMQIQYTDSTGVTLMAATDLDGNGKKDLIFDFGTSTGYWAYENNSTWLKIPYTNAAGLTLQAVTDLDGNGQKDLIFNFGTNQGQGYWAFENNSTWTKIDYTDTTGITMPQGDAETITRMNLESNLNPQTKGSNYVMVGEMVKKASDIKTP